MSLYESLDLFVGAGLLASVPAVGCAVAPEAVRRAGGLSAFLRSRGEADAVGVLLDQLARDIWLGQETRGVPHTLAEHHAEALAHLMAECPPDAGLIATALAVGCSASCSAAASAPNLSLCNSCRPSHGPCSRRWTTNLPPPAST